MIFLYDNWILCITRNFLIITSTACLRPMKKISKKIKFYVVFIDASLEYASFYEFVYTEQDLNYFQKYSNITTRLTERLLQIFSVGLFIIIHIKI